MLRCILLHFVILILFNIFEEQHCYAAEASPPLATSKIIKIFPNDYGLNLSWSSNGSRLASGSIDSISVWTVSSLESHTLTSPKIIDSIEFSPNGRHIASGSRDKKIWIWDLSSKRCIRKLSGLVQGHSAWISAVSWSPDSKQLASGSEDKKVKLWDTSSGKCLLTLKGCPNKVSGVAWSPDGKQLAVTSEVYKKRPEVKLWDHRTPQCIHTIQDSHTYAVWSPHGEFMATLMEESSRSIGHYISIWDLRMYACINQLQESYSTLVKFDWSHHVNYIASSDGFLHKSKGVKIWNPRTGECLNTTNPSGLDVKWSPVESEIAVSLTRGFDDFSTEIREITTLSSGNTSEEEGISAVPTPANAPDVVAEGFDDRPEGG